MKRNDLINALKSPNIRDMMQRYETEYINLKKENLLKNDKEHWKRACLMLYARLACELNVTQEELSEFAEEQDISILSYFADL